MDEIRHAEELLNEALKIAKESGVEVKKHLLIRGKPPGKDIVSFAEDAGAKMIVMGAGIVKIHEETLLGKVTEYVITHSKQPVLLVK